MTSACSPEPSSSQSKFGIEHVCKVTGITPSIGMPGSWDGLGYVGICFAMMPESWDRVRNRRGSLLWLTGIRSPDSSDLSMDFIEMKVVVLVQMYEFLF